MVVLEPAEERNKGGVNQNDEAKQMAEGSHDDLGAPQHTSPTTLLVLLPELRLPCMEGLMHPSRRYGQVIIG